MSYPMDTYRNSVPLMKYPIRLDVGAGRYPKPGFVRLDNDPCDGETDIVWDIKRGLPLPDDSVSELFCSHCLEHFEPIYVHYIVREMFRVCVPGSKLTIVVPHEDTPEGRLICHYVFWNENTMHGINQWFPHRGHQDYNGNYFDGQRVWREPPYNLFGEFVIVKGAPV